jgi:hypothetical protein
MMPAMKKALLLVMACAGVAHAQVPLRAPDASPAAELEQTVGLTQMKVTYHRPGVNKRVVWGALVPFDQVWRAGANENTTVTFSTDVKVAGKPLAAGTYGLHMIPTTKEWTIIFSNMSVAWGSFSYDQKEDALRVTVAPKAGPMEERLSYRFDDPTETKVALTMAWEKLAISIPIEVDTPKVVMASMRAELRGLPRFSWQGWARAAQYWILNGGDLNEAQTMADKSIAMAATFGNLMTKALILDKQGKSDEAKELRVKAFPLGAEAEINQWGYTLLQQKRIDEAIGVFQKNVDAHPDSFNVYDSLGEALLTKGDKKGALAQYEKALTLAKDEPNKKRITEIVTRLKKG